LDRRIDRVLAAVARARVGHDHSYLVIREVERTCQLAPHAERLLRARPDSQLAILPLRDTHSRLQRGMCDVCDGVGGVQPLLRGLERRFETLVCLLSASL